MLTRATAKAPEQPDLFSEEVTLLFPVLLALEGRLLGNAVRQQAVPSALTPCRLKPFTVRRVSFPRADLCLCVDLQRADASFFLCNKDRFWSLTAGGTIRLIPPVSRPTVVMPRGWYG